MPGAMGRPALSRWSDVIIKLPQRDDYRQLLLGDALLLDVRAPVEYGQGSFPGAHNLPIMNDEEREAIGLRYKEQGQESAVVLGHQLVSGDVKRRRVAGWVEFAQQQPEGALFCFRGGMRSKIAQQWIYEQAGIVYPRVKGGYKAMRRFLIDELEHSVAHTDFTILSGRTGVGKTKLLHQLVRYIDLEGIYRHNGSAFGKRPLPQPSQIDVENELSITLLKHRQQRHDHLLLEDESANIGSRRLPNSLLAKMGQAPVVVLESALEARVALIYQQYVLESRRHYQSVFGDELGVQHWSDNLLDALARIQRRLGGGRYLEAKAKMEAALVNPYLSAVEAHQAWITYLLTEYYDAMYDYQLSRKADRVVFRGDEQAVTDYLRQQF